MPVTINGTTGITTPNLNSAGTVTTSSLVNGTALAFRNKIINGNFDIWQRGTSLGSGTADRYLADRFSNSSIGSTYTASRQSFSNGQTDVLNNPSYFHRTIVSSVAGNNNYCFLQQSIENVATLAGQTATLSFYAKADSAKPISIEFIQKFGTGGSPSSVIYGIEVQKLNLTASWQKFTVTANIPSIAGKTIGTNSDNGLSLNFWFDAGSDFNSRTNSLGQQSGTFDIAQVQLEAGSVTTPFENRPIGTELALCQRYYEKSYDITVIPGSVTKNGLRNAGNSSQSDGTLNGGSFPFIISKRASPTMNYWDSAGTSNKYTTRVSSAWQDNRTLTAVSASENTAIVDSGTQTQTSMLLHYTASAEL